MGLESPRAALGSAYEMIDITLPDVVGKSELWSSDDLRIVDVAVAASAKLTRQSPHARHAPHDSDRPPFRLRTCDWSDAADAVLRVLPPGAR